MKAVKYVLVGAGVLVGLVALSLAVLLFVVDGAFVKARMEGAMKEKNRTLKIEGTPQLKLFPVAGLALGKTTLSEPGSDQAFLALDSVEVAVRTMPLFSGEVAIEVLKLSGARVNVVRRKDGSMNFSDLEDRKSKDKGKAEAPPNLRIAGMSVEKVQVSYRDEASGQELNVAEFSLKTGRLDGQTPGDVALAARVTGKRPEADLRAQVSGALRFNLRREEFAFDKFLVQVKGRYDQDNVSAEFSAPKVEVSPSKALGSEVKGAVQIKGPQRNLDLKLLIAAMEGSATALSIPKITLDLALALGGVAAKANLNASMKANLAKQDFNAEIGGRVDEGNVKIKLAATNFAPLKASFEAEVDRVNADRYVPPEKKDGKGDEPINLGFLRGKTVSGKAAIGELTVQRVKMENVKAEVKLADGKLEISPHSAALYGGTLTGAISADANGNRVTVKEDIKNVALGQLLRDYARKDMLEGKGDVVIDVNSAGATTLALKRALAGNARIAMKEGAIKGINLNDPMKNVKSALPLKSSKHDPSQKTDITDLSATFAIKNGVARNDDLKAKGPLIVIGGAGNLDIGNNGIDYLAKATTLANVTIPVKLSGALDSPTWNVDYSAVLGSAGGLLGKTAGGLADTAKKGGSGVGEAVRGLFRR
jgi:AsmA protein